MLTCAWDVLLTEAESDRIHHCLCLLAMRSLATASESSSESSGSEEGDEEAAGTARPYQAFAYSYGGEGSTAAADDTQQGEEQAPTGMLQLLQLHVGILLTWDAFLQLGCKCNYILEVVLSGSPNTAIWKVHCSSELSL